MFGKEKRGRFVDLVGYLHQGFGNPAVSISSVHCPQGNLTNMDLSGWHSLSECRTPSFYHENRPDPLGGGGLTLLLFCFLVFHVS